MTLYDYLTSTEEGTEVAVCDKEYDMESYFYNDIPDEDDKWQTAMLELAKLLTVTETNGRCVIVNLSEIISNKIDKLNEANLFIRCNLNAIMNDMQNIISGYVSEEWFTRFVDVLKEN